MSVHQGIQKKAVHSPLCHAGELPAVPARLDAALMKQRATDWLRKRGLMAPSRRWKR